MFFLRSSSPLFASLVGLFFGVVFPEAGAAESFLALGNVNSNGSLASHAKGSGASVVASRLATGSYEVSIVKLGAFQGASPDDFVISAGIESAVSSDTGITGTIESITNDALVLRFRTADLEQSGSPDDPVAVDQPFYFLVRESPESSTIEGDSRHLLAAGIYSGSLSANTHFGVGGVTAKASAESAGNVELFLEQSGAFVGDDSEDYLVFLTPLGGGTEDQALRADVKSTLLDHSVVFTIRTDDVQAQPAGNAGVPVNGGFAFAIYRINEAETAGLPASRMISFTASVAGNDGLKRNGSASIPGATVISSRTSAGVYSVRLISPGGFPGFIAPIVTIRGGLLDRVASAQISSPGADTLEVTVRTKDVQATGQSGGVPVDTDFDLVVYETFPTFVPDLAVGIRNEPAAMRFFGASTPQVATVRLRGTEWGRFFIGYENAGRLSDGLRLDFSGTVYYFESRILRIDGRNRTNLTAQSRVGGLAAEAVRPGERVYFEGGFRHKSANRRFSGTNTIRGSSVLSPRPTFEFLFVRAVAR